MNPDKLRKKRLAKLKRREKKVAGLSQAKKNTQENFVKKLKIFNAGKELRYWQKHFHFHKWSKLGVKKPEGGYRIIGKICNKCGKRVYYKDWLGIIRKKISDIFAKK